MLVEADESGGNPVVLPNPSNLLQPPNDQPTKPIESGKCTHFRIGQICEKNYTRRQR